MGTLGSALQRAHGAGGWAEQRQSPEGILVPDWRWAEAPQDPGVQGHRGAEELGQGGGRNLCHWNNSYMLQLTLVRKQSK